jgi:hypothetical protein
MNTRGLGEVAFTYGNFALAVERLAVLEHSTEIGVPPRNLTVAYHQMFCLRHSILMDGRCFCRITAFHQLPLTEFDKRKERGVSAAVKFTKIYILIAILRLRNRSMPAPSSVYIALPNTHPR